MHGSIHKLIKKRDEPPHAANERSLKCELIQSYISYLGHTLRYVEQSEQKM